MASTYTYDDKANREDLLDIITNISPTDTQLMSGLAVSSANNVVHQWLADTLKSVAYNSYVEGADASYPDRTDPSRLQNYTQIVRVGFDVSDSERAVNSAGFTDRYAYEQTKALKEWKADAEYSMMRASLSCGNNSTARSMLGVINFMVSNNFTNASGISLTEALLNDRLNDVWTDGVEVNAIYCPMYMKRKISAFTAGATKQVDITDKRLVNSVDVYEADAAKMVKLFAHRYVTVSGDTNYGVVGINEDFWRIAYLRKPFARELAKDGDSTRGEVVGELTLECLAKDAGFAAMQML
jgi:hypothetical protein